MRAAENIDIHCDAKIDDGAAIHLTKNPDGTFSGTIENVSPGTHLLELIYFVPFDGGDDIILCTYSNSVEVAAGDTATVTISDSSYTIVFVGTPPVKSGGVYWKQDANGYRLPTEAEWEYAARAGSTTAFANGDIRSYEVMSVCNYDPILDAIGWYCDNNGESDTPEHGPKPVARKDSNVWGLFDMHGNVWEWCQDWYSTYPSGAVSDPVGPHRARTGCIAAVPGGTLPGAAGRLAAAKSCRTLADTTSGFGLLCPKVSKAGSQAEHSMG